jgi:hypothetical protein
MTSDCAICRNGSTSSLNPRAPFPAPVKGGQVAAGSAGLRPSDRRGRARMTELVGSEGMSKLSVSPRECQQGSFPLPCFPQLATAPGEVTDKIIAGHDLAKIAVGNEPDVSGGLGSQVNNAQ